jgi:hypothetical protein
LPAKVKEPEWAWRAVLDMDRRARKKFHYTYRTIRSENYRETQRLDGHAQVFAIALSVARCLQSRRTITFRQFAKSYQRIC